MSEQHSFSSLIEDLKQQADGSWAGSIPESWMQGRTTYGGLSAALCLAATQKNHPQLPPLRSALINFVGPAGGAYEVSTTVLREGKSVVTIRCELVSQGQVATHAVFSFGASRESRLDESFTAAPNQPSAAESRDFFEQGQGPSFTRYFDSRLASGALPISGSEDNELFMWTRHTDRQATDIVALIGLADMPPPAVLPMFTEFAPISSMTWMVNVLQEDLSTEDGWWLLRSAAENAQHGYSSQDMQVWNSKGDLVISGRQSVTLFY